MPQMDLTGSFTQSREKAHDKRGRALAMLKDNFKKDESELKKERVERFAEGIALVEQKRKEKEELAEAKKAERKESLDKAIQKQGQEETESIASIGIGPTGKPPVAEGDLSPIAGGVLDAAEATGNLFLEVGSGIEQFVSNNTELNPSLFKSIDRLDFADKLIPQKNDPVSPVIRSISQFLVPFGAASKAARGIKAVSKAGQFAKASAIGGVVDFAAFDPTEGNLANLLNDWTEGRSEILEFLAKDEDDTAFEGRLKQMLEGFALGAGAEAIVKIGELATLLGKGVRAYKARAKFKKELGSEITEDAVFNKALNSLEDKVKNPIEIEIAGEKFKDQTAVVERLQENLAKRGNLSSETRALIREEVEKLSSLKKEGKLDQSKFSNKKIKDLEKQLKKMEAEEELTRRALVKESEKLTKERGVFKNTEESLATLSEDLNLIDSQIKDIESFAKTTSKIEGKPKDIESLLELSDLDLETTRLEDIPEFNSIADEDSFVQFQTSLKEVKDLSVDELASRHPSVGKEKFKILKDDLLSKKETAGKILTKERVKDIRKKAISSDITEKTGAKEELTELRRQKKDIENAIKEVKKIRESAVKEQKVLDLKNESEFKSTRNKNESIKVNDKGDIDINIQRFNQKEFDKTMEVLEAKHRQTSLTERKRGVLKDEEVDYLAKMSGMSKEEILSRELGDSFPVEKIRASKEILQKSWDETMKVAELVLDPPKGSNELILQADLHLAASNYQLYFNEVSAAISESARVTREGKSLKTFKAAAKQIEIAGGGGSAKKLAERLKTIAETGGELDLGRRRNVGQKLGDAVFEVWINGLLSSPSTPMVNIVSALGVVATRNVENFLTAGAGVIRKTGGGIKSVNDFRKVLSGKGATPEQLKKVFSKGYNNVETLSFAQATAGLKGSLEGLIDGFIIAGKTLRKGKLSREATKAADLSAKQAISAEAFELTGTLGQAVDYLGHAINVPGRLLITGDEFAKAVNRRMNTKMLAHKELENLNFKLKEQGEAPENMTKKFYDEVYERNKLEIESQVKIDTFTNEAEGLTRKITEAVDFLKDEVGFAPLRVFFPFIRTNMNILAHSIERSPLAPILSRRWKAEWAAGGIARDRALAKMSLGTTIIGIGAYSAASGKITGKGPLNNQTKKIMKDVGFQEESITIDGKEYFKFDRVDPLGAMLSWGASLAELAGKAPDKDIAQIAATAGVLLIESLGPEFLIEGTGNIMEIIQDSSGRRLRNFAAKFPNQLIPFSQFRRSVRTLTDPQKRLTRGEFTKEFKEGASFIDEMINHIYNNTPGLSSSLEPQRNLLGDIVLYNQGVALGIASPIAGSKADDKVSQELIKLGLVDRDLGEGLRHQKGFLTMPDRRLQLKEESGIENYVILDDVMYNKLVTLGAGIDLEDADLAGVPLKKALEIEIKNKYPSLRTEGKQVNEFTKRAMVKKIVSQYRTAAKKQLIEKHFVNRAMELEAKMNELLE